MTRSSLGEIFCPGGVLEMSLPDHEYRPSQLAMAEAVQEAIENREHLCVEAGTGTGKTLAYLVPALRVQKRVVISTATINLQEQLLTQDLPFVRRTLFPDLRAASAFSFNPPIGKTRPRKVTSPVMANPFLTLFFAIAEYSAVAMVIPADGPSLGIAPAGT